MKGRIYLLGSSALYYLCQLLPPVFGETDMFKLNYVVILHNQHFQPHYEGIAPCVVAGIKPF